MSNLLPAAEQVASEGRLYAPAGEARGAMIDPRFVGVAAAAALTGAAEDGQTSAPSTARRCRSAAGSSSRTGRREWRSTARTCSSPRSCSPSTTAPTKDLATKFFEHFALIASALNEKGLWNEDDGFYYDVLHLGDGAVVPLRARSVVGLLPLAAVTTLGPRTMASLPDFMQRVEWFTANRPEGRDVVQHMESPEHAGWRMLSIVDEERLRRILAVMLDESEFLSSHGIRALSRYHADHPLQVSVDGVSATLDYEPGESTSGLFGGNSNWLGPIWFPINYLLLTSLRVYHRYLGDTFQVECPSGSGKTMNLAEVADELAARLTAIFLERDDGTRPVFGGYRLFQEDPAWRGLIPFHEYFHGDTGAGLGASHQTGWTGLVADLIIHRGRG